MATVTTALREKGSRQHEWCVEEDSMVSPWVQ